MPATLAPWLESRYCDANGHPLAGGRIFTYRSGTTTPQAAYTSAAGDVALPNPVLCDAAGRAPLWLRTDLAYDVVVQDADGVQQYSVSQLAGGAGGAGQTSVTTTLGAQAGQAVVSAVALVPLGARILAVRTRVITTFGSSQGLTGLAIGGQGLSGGWGSSALTEGATTGPTTPGHRADLPIATLGNQDILVEALGGLMDAQGQLEITVWTLVTP